MNCINIYCGAELPPYREKKRLCIKCTGNQFTSPIIYKCTVCDNKITMLGIKGLPKKYCSINCSKKASLKRKLNVTRKEYDLFCMECNTTLPLGTHRNKNYCKKCLRLHRKHYQRSRHISKTMKTKLDNFYKNIRINFIQSPYLTV